MSFLQFLAISGVLLLQVCGNSDDYYTAFHAQTLHNWENDPNGPFYLNGTYHLFMQYNPHGYVWGDMHWYHMKSSDLVHWTHLPVALAPDKDYDCGGVFSGSATIVDGIPVISYSVQCQNFTIQAVPTNMSDPNLTNWTKPSYNPVYKRPNSTTAGDFRDPSGAWKSIDGQWRQVTACDDGPCVFKSNDFRHWDYVGRLFEGVMMECPDFFPLDGSDLWFFKGSDDGDWWVYGKFDQSKDRFEVTSPGGFRENNQRMDWGQFYASKTFYDPVHSRRVLFGWSNYHCDDTDWAGVQTFPRTVKLDPNNASFINFYPIPEIEGLRVAQHHKETTALEMKAGEDLLLKKLGSQLDIQIKFGFPLESLAGDRFVFGVRVFVDPANSTQFQEINVEITKGNDTGTFGGQPFSMIPSDDNTVQLRVLVDRSVSEVFVQGGRSVATLPYCSPSPKNLDTMGIQVFNSEVTALPMVIKSMEVYTLKTANVRPKL